MIFHDVVLRYIKFSLQFNHSWLTLQKCWEELPYEVPPNGEVFDMGTKDQMNTG